MPARKFPAVAFFLVAWGCAEIDPAPPAAEPDPTALTREVDVLSSRVEGGEVDAAEFDRTLAPFETAAFDRWPEPQLEELVSSFQRLRTSLVTRYQIVDPICTDDSWVRYSLCQTGYPCVAAVQLAELHCLWFVSH
jgi:hypothetical protein